MQQSLQAVPYEGQRMKLTAVRAPAAQLKTVSPLVAIAILSKFAVILAIFK